MTLPLSSPVPASSNASVTVRILWFGGHRLVCVTVTLPSPHVTEPVPKSARAAGATIAPATKQPRATASSFRRIETSLSGLAVSERYPRRSGSNPSGLLGLRPGLSALDVDVVREAEDALGDDVSLDLGRPAADRQGRREQEAAAPAVVVRAQRAGIDQESGRPGELLREVHDVLAVVVREGLPD